MRVIRFGRLLFGFSVMGLAGLGLVYGNFRTLLDPLPVSLPRPEIWAYASAAMLLAAGAGIFFARTALVSAMTVGIFESIWTVTRVRPLFLKPLSVGLCYGFFEALGPLIGAWILFALVRRQDVAHASTVITGDRALRVARCLFGAACVEYGAGHFAYAAYTAAMVPAWLPGPTGIAYFTGACHAAAGLGLLFGIYPRLAATMEGIMMSLFGILVWLPSFFAYTRPEWASPAQVQWSETLLTFLMAGSAFIVAESLGRALPVSRQTSATI